MSKRFIEIIVREALCVDDWRGYCECEDEEGYRWELRGESADTPGRAAANAYDAYNDSTENWEDFGYGIDSWCRGCDELFNWPDLTTTPDGPYCINCIEDAAWKEHNV